MDEVLKGKLRHPQKQGKNDELHERSVKPYNILATAIVKKLPRGCVNRLVKSTRMSPNNLLRPKPASMYHSDEGAANGSIVEGRFQERAVEP